MIFVHAFYVVMATVALLYLSLHSQADVVESQDMLDKMLAATCRLGPQGHHPCLARGALCRGQSTSGDDVAGDWQRHPAHR